MQERAMTDDDWEKLIRKYAAGEVRWQELRERGFDDYVEVLGGEGLRPPIAGGGKETNRSRLRSL